MEPDGVGAGVPLRQPAGSGQALSGRLGIPGRNFTIVPVLHPRGVPPHPRPAEFPGCPGRRRTLGPSHPARCVRAARRGDCPSDGSHPPEPAIVAGIPIPRRVVPPARLRRRGSAGLQPGNRSGARRTPHSRLAWVRAQPSWRLAPSQRRRRTHGGMLSRVRNSSRRSSLREQGPQPLWNRVAQFCKAAVFNNGDEAERGSQVVVVEDPHMWQLAEGGLEIDEDAWKPCDQLFGGNIVSALGDAHGHALFRPLWAGSPDKAQDRGITCLRGSFEKGQLLAHGIGEDGLEYEALALSYKLLPKGIGEPGSGIGFDVQFPSQHVGIHKAQPGWLEMGMVERRLPGPIWSRNGDDDGAPVERKAHFLFAVAWTGRNWRFTNRPEEMSLSLD